MSKRVWIPLAGLGVGLAFVGMLVFAWSVDETHFDRPDEGFDRLVSRVDDLPGVTVDAAERWVEAPTFSDPAAWIGLTVDRAALPALLEAACASADARGVGWSLQVRTEDDRFVSLAERPDVYGDTACVDLGFDAVGLVAAVDGVAPGLDLLAAVRDGGFVISTIEGDGGDLRQVLPLVARAAALRQAAGLSGDEPVQVDAVQLGLRMQPGDEERSLALLTELVERHDVTAFWAGGGGTPIDGVEKVQVVAPEGSQAAVEAAIRRSGLPAADLPVRFIPEAS